MWKNVKILRFCTCLAFAGLVLAAFPGTVAPTAFAQNPVAGKPSVLGNVPQPLPTGVTVPPDDKGKVIPPPAKPDAIDYTGLIKILFSVLVIATILESALAVIFNSSLFLSFFSRRALKTPISVGLCWLVAWRLQLDVVTQLNHATGGPDQGLLDLGYFLSGLVLAGGSAGVRNIMEAFGWRDPLPADTRPTGPDKSKAWVSVRAERADRIKPLNVFLLKSGGNEELVGTIHAGKPVSRGLAWALIDHTRFPPVAGRSVEGGEEYTVSLRYPDGTAAGLKWGPNRIAEGAIIDILIDI